jgi:hypothetical protein
VRYENFFNATKNVVTKQGIITLWRGQTAKLLAIIPETVRFYLTKYALNLTQEAQRRKNYGKKQGTSFFYLLTAFTLSYPSMLFVIQPLSNAYVKMAAEQSSSRERKYKNVFTCLKAMYDHEGVEGFYIGMDAAIVEQLVDFTLSYFLFSYVDRYLVSSTSGPLLALLKGCITPIASNAITYPLKTVRSRLAFASGDPFVKYENTFDCFMRICREEGWKALYKGLDTRIVRIVLRNALIIIAETVLSSAGITGSPPSYFVVRL